MSNQPGWDQQWGQQPQQNWPPQQNWGQPPQAPKPKKKWPRVVFAVVGVLLIAFLTRLGFVIVDMQSKQADDDPTAPTANERDPILALTQSPGTGVPGHYGGTAMYDACEFVPMDALDNLGLPPTPAMTVVHHYFDGDVPPGQTVEEDTLAPGMCGYVFPKQTGVTVEVFQPPYTEPDRMVSWQPNPKDGPISQDRGFNVQNFYDQGNNWWDVRIARPDLVVRATVKGPRDTGGGRSETGHDGKPIADALIQPILARALAGPTPHRQYEFTGPYAGQKDACEVFTPQAVEAVLHNPVKPQASASYLAGDAVMTEFDGSVSYRVDTRCTRNTLIEGGSIGDGHGEAKLSLSTWQDARGATTRQASVCRDKIMGTTPIPLQDQLGDGPVCAMNSATGTTSLAFKVGNTTADLSVSDAAQDPLQEARRLMPLAQQVVAGLAG
ncbi:hypothetical protein REH65_26775 [Saccharopolyspora sp. ID03-671]|uniref:hypothetical protein n=1 Tax=Saccharopolyspora sp. ID03-671 TaxID=3073066 RepID=UPI00325193E0